MVFSDPHVLADTLFDADAKAFETVKAEDPKLAAHSQELFDSAVARIAQAAPSFLLIPGDLTHNGAYISHQYVSNSLNKLVEKGIQVFVIPGNHDLCNPYASSYFGDTREKADWVTAEDFEQLYTNCGYSNAIMRQPDALSYLAYPAKNIALLCLDSSQPNINDCYSAGGLTEETLSWAEEAAAIAKADGRTTIAMMHHQLMEHFDRHAELAPTYIANLTEGYPNLVEVQQRLSNAGIQVVFTGHFHTNSIQRVDFEETPSLYDVSTGSTCTYASPIRTAEIEDDGTLSISTEFIPLYHEEEKEHNDKIVTIAMSKAAAILYPVMNSYVDQLPATVKMFLKLPSSESKMASDLKTYLGPVSLKVYNYFAHGDEDQENPDAVMEEWHSAVKSYLLYTCNGSSLVAQMLINALGDTYTENMAEADALLSSILYNYVGSIEHYVPDGAITFEALFPSAIRSTNQDFEEETLPIDLMGRTANAETKIRISNHKTIIKL